MTELLSFTPVIMTKAQAQAVINSMEDTDCVLMGIVDYEKNRTTSKLKPIKLKKSKIYIDKAQMIVFIGDKKKVFSHMDLHSTFQDYTNIQPIGIIRTIMLPGL